MRNDNVYTFVYAGAICLVCSILLSLAATGLKPMQEANQKLDVRKNIMLSLGVIERDTSKTAVELNSMFENQVQGLVFDAEGKILEGMTPEELTEKDAGKRFALFRKVVDGQVVGFSFPIVGKGLWSTLKGYLALGADADTVLGITFYSHGETPGLGAEIDQPWFQNNFVGKKVRDANDRIVSVTVAKGKAVDSGKPIEHVVDGISGATITANGVTEMVRKALMQYEPYFSRIRGS